MLASKVCLHGLGNQQSHLLKGMEPWTEKEMKLYLGSCLGEQFI